ncbi:MAG: penicillin-binding transpeptidase domain-containing protein [Polyangiaceae bacterium]
MLHTKLPHAALGLVLSVGCASQPLPATHDCPSAPVAQSLPGPSASTLAPQSLNPAASSRGLLRDRSGRALSAEADDTPPSLRPWIGSLTDNGRGGSGLQARFDSELAGGRDVQVSLDASLHRALEAAFVDVEQAAGVVLRVDDGGVLALYSTLPHTSHAGLERRHLATSWPDACGSAAKPFTALAALAAGVSKPDTTYECSGKLKVGRREFRCWAEHGPLDLAHALALSDNIYFFQLARLLSVDGISKAQHGFGLGEAVALFPEAPVGWIPSSEALEGDGRKPDDATKLSQAIGHNIAVTPLQLARGYAALASGKLTEPSFGAAASRATEISASYAQFLPVIRAALRRTVTDQDGTAHVAGTAPDVSGKTGTAQRAFSRAMPNAPDSGWFAGWAPANNPRIAFAFRAEGLSGRQVAERVLKAMEAAGR